MKSICLVSYLFAPTLSAESMALLKKVRALAGHFDLTVVTARNDAGVYPNDPMLDKYIPSNVQVVRVPITSGPRALHKAAHLAGRILFRGSATAQYYDLCWARNAAAAVRNRRFDILMTNAQHMCSHVAGYWAKSSMNVPWVQHYSDPLQHAAARKRFLPAQKIDDWFLPKLLRQTSLVTVPSAEMRDSFFDAFASEARNALLAKTIVVPHTYDDEFMVDAVKLYPERKHYFDGSAIHVCYTGNLYGIRSAKLVANVLRRLKLGNKKEIVIHVFGSTRPADRKLLEELGSSVRFHGNVSYFESLAVMQHADVLLLLDVPAPKSPFFPSKLAEYLGTSRRILVLASPESATARIAKEMKLPVYSYNEEPIRIADDGNTQDVSNRRAYSNRLENYRELIERIENLS